MPRGADAENILPFLPTRHVKTRPLSHYPRVSALARQRRRHTANASALNISTNTYASDDIPLAFSGSFIVENMSPKPSAPTVTGLATPPASQVTVPTRLPMSPPPEEEIRKWQASSYALTTSPATRNTSTTKLQSSRAPVTSRKRARSVTTPDEGDIGPKTKNRKQAKTKVVPPMLAGTKRPRHPPSPGVPSFADDLARVIISNPKARKQPPKLVEPDTPIRPSASTNVPRTEFIERRKPTSVDLARRRRRTVSPLRIPPPDPRTFKPAPPPSPSEDPLLLKGSKRRRRVRKSDVKHPRPESPIRASKDKGRVPSSSNVHTPRVFDYHQDMGAVFNDTTEWGDQSTYDYVTSLKFNLSSSSQQNSSTKPGSVAGLASPYPLAKKAKNSPLPVRSPVAEENEFWGTTHDMGHGPPSDVSDNEELVPVPSVPEFQTKTKPPTMTPIPPVATPAARERTPPPAVNVLPRARAPTPRRKTLSERMAELGPKLGEGSSFRAPARFMELDALRSDSVSPVEDLTPPSDDTNEVIETTTQNQDSSLDLVTQDERLVVMEIAAEEMETPKEVEFPLLDGARPDETNGTAATESVEQSFDQSFAGPSGEESLDVSPSPQKDGLSTHNRLHSPMFKQSTPKARLSDLPTESSPATPRFEFQSPTSHMVKPSPFFHQTPIRKQFQQTYDHFDFDFQAPTSSSLRLINIPAITTQSQHQDSFNNGADKAMEVVEAFNDDDESSWGGEDEDGEPLVHVCSKNPVAAARAAAILKLHHDYIEGSQRKRRRTSSFGSVCKPTPSIRGSPALLRRVETELATPLKGVAANRSFGSIGDTSIWAMPTTIDFALLTGNETVNELSRDGQKEHIEDEERAGEEGDREPTPPPPATWTKNEWRLLEQCFTDARDDLACTLDVVEVDVDEINLDEVVQRFVDVDEGKHELIGDWAWNKIRRRAFALKDRQRSGAARNLGVEMATPARSLYSPLRTPSVEPQAHVRPLPAPTPTRSNNAPASTSFTTPRYNRVTLGPIPVIREIAATPTPASTRRVTTDMPPPSVIPVKSTMPPPVSPSPALVPAPKAAPTTAPAPALRPSKPYVVLPSTPLGPTIRNQPSPASNRVWDWMGSFLTRTPQSSAKKPTPNPVKLYPVLPPVSDGDRDALKHIEPVLPRSPEKVVHPKDQVQLQHVPTPDSVRPPPKIKLSHKGSSGSVRDLVKSFEGLQEETKKRELAIKGEVAKLKRMGSGGSLRSNMSVNASSTVGDTTSKKGRNTSFNSSYESSRSSDDSASWIRR